MKKSRRTYNGVHLNKKSNTQDVVEQSLTNFKRNIIECKKTSSFPEAILMSTKGLASTFNKENNNNTNVVFATDYYSIFCK